MLVHVGDEVREGLSRTWDPDELVAAVDLDIDDLADRSRTLPGHGDRRRFRSRCHAEPRAHLEQVLSYDEDSAGRPDEPGRGGRADTTVDVVLRYLRLRGEL